MSAPSLAEQHQAGVTLVALLAVAVRHEYWTAVDHLAKVMLLMAASSMIEIPETKERADG